MQNSDLCLFDQCFVPQKTLGELARTLPTPFYLYDEAGLRHGMGKITRAFAWSAGHRQFFPLRLTPSPAVLEILRAEGCGVQCCSMPELLLAEQCGFFGADIIFAPLFPTGVELDTADRLRATILLDSANAAEVVLGRNSLPDQVLLRYNPGGKFAVRAQTIGRLERSKLGMPKQTLFQVASLLHKRGVSWIGLQADPTKQAVEPDYYAALGQVLHELAVELREKTRVSVAVLNLGGDLGLGFLPEQESADVLVMGERGRSVLQPLMTGRSIPIHTTIGRYLTGPNGILVSRVMTVQKTHRNFVVLDATVGNFMRAAQGTYHHVSVVEKICNAGRVYCDVVGRVPEAEARFAERRMLPAPVPGECCVIHNAGFCGSAMESAYGGTARCAHYLYQADGAVRLIRQAQTVQDVLNSW